MMSSRFFSTKMRRNKIETHEFKRLFPYGYFKFRAQAVGTHFPYPILGMGAHRRNNCLHEAILNNDIERLGEMARQKPELLKGVSWGNTPLNLAMKRGHLEAVRVIIDAMEENYSSVGCGKIFAERDSMGFLPLSYALFLRAPLDVMLPSLIHTKKRTYYTDDVYRLFVEGLEIPESKSEFEITEAGYQLKEGKGGFAIYELTPLQLLCEAMPLKLSIKGDIVPEKDYGIIELGQTRDLSFYQILRNLLFHLSALCENRGIKPVCPEEGILSSHDLRLFDVEHNYPELAKSRNRQLSNALKVLVSSWENTALDKTWHPPEAIEEKSTLIP